MIFLVNTQFKMQHGCLCVSFLCFLFFSLLVFSFGWFAVFWALDHSDDNPLLPWFHGSRGSQVATMSVSDADKFGFATTIGAYSGIIVLPTQTMHFEGQIHQHYHKFALYWYFQNGSHLMIPDIGVRWLSLMLGCPAVSVWICVKCRLVCCVLRRRTWTEKTSARFLEVTSKDLWHDMSWLVDQLLGPWGWETSRLLIGNPYNGYINPYYWVDFPIPYYMEIMGVDRPWHISVL